MAGFRSSILAGTSLVRQAIKSPNFAAGSTGWSVNKDGSAEFNDVIIRGGTTVSGDFLAYQGAPAAGTLILAISAEGGTDEFGNTYPPGVVSYGVSGGENVITRLNAAEISFATADQSTHNNGFMFYQNLGAGVYELTIGVVGSGNGTQISLNSETALNAKDGSIALTTNRVQVEYLDADNVGLGLVASAYSLSNVNFTSTETVLMQTQPITWQGGRVYRVDVDFAVRSDTANGFFLFNIRKNGATGASWITQRRAESIPNNPGQVRYISMRFYLTPTADITSALAFTGTANGSTTGTMVGDNAGAMATLNVVDVGVALPAAGLPGGGPGWAAIPIS